MKNQNKKSLRNSNSNQNKDRSAEQRREWRQIKEGFAAKLKGLGV